ncbi:hypothetical protein BLNAU_17021 [Blattamonas nauphoetae]|uniref:Uncharacterized protein n=1 Tax=Blattamonas nauphoetae TaxID=2049346 RepID=A0ABQ9X9J3_9EUKA|nr:hypothetical protein BLNAU_17021 [Blattamonas nauphoetae]
MLGRFCIPVSSSSVIPESDFHLFVSTHDLPTDTTTPISCPFACSMKDERGKSDGCERVTARSEIDDEVKLNPLDSVQYGTEKLSHSSLPLSPTPDDFISTFKVLLVLLHPGCVYSEDVDTSTASKGSVSPFDERRTCTMLIAATTQSWMSCKVGTQRGDVVVIMIVFCSFPLARDANDELRG